MRHVLLFAAIVALLLATTTPVLAKEEDRATEPPGGMPPEADLEAVLAKWLATGDDLHAAWAGWIVAERRLDALAGPVRDRLARTSEGAGRRHPRFFVQEALLDALIRVGGSAPGKTLVALAGPHVEAVTVLLCRRRSVGPAHLAVFRMLGRGPKDEAYVALGNQLAAWRVPAFVARILQNMKLRRRVRIWDEDPPYPPFRGPADSVPG